MNKFAESKIVMLLSELCNGRPKKGGWGPMFGPPWIFMILQNEMRSKLEMLPSACQKYSSFWDPYKHTVDFSQQEN